MTSTKMPVPGVHSFAILLELINDNGSNLLVAQCEVDISNEGISDLGRATPLSIAEA